MYKHALKCVIGVAVSAFLAGCGGGSSSNDNIVELTTDLTTNLNIDNVNNNSAGSIPINNINLDNKVKDLSLTIPDSSLVAISNPELGFKITEISSVSANIPWLEVYNPNKENVNLSSHKLRAIAFINGEHKLLTFNLPDIIVPSNGYVVISPKKYPWLTTGGNVAYLDQDNITPVWGSQTFLELIYKDETSDAISIDSNYKPVTADFKVKNLNYIPNKNSLALWNGEWQNMNFATPGAINDTPPSAIDEDADGIPTTAKQEGSTFGGIDIYAMGARKGQKDLFIQNDYMNNVISIPQIQALDKVKQAFAKKNIILHMDVGALFSNTFNPAQYNLGKANAFAAENCTVLGTKNSQCGSVYEYKKNMPAMRRSFFHYVLWAKSQVPTGIGPSGIAELNGKNSLITLKGWGLDDGAKDSISSNLLINYQAAALMHELGHNLGLLHGGDDHITYKPNYVSTMNYLYQFRGLPQNVNSFIDRFFNFMGLNGMSLCSLSNSPCSANFNIDYSNGILAAIDESNIIENNLDWNNDGKNNSTPYSIDLNGDKQINILHDYNDWANIKLHANTIIRNNNDITIVNINNLYMGGMPLVIN